MPAPAPETRSDWALRRLRTAILTGEFPPGTKLRAEDLAERWQVSPTPLREAFQRLGGARLLELLPQRGVRVAEFTLEDAADLYALRLRLEPPALRQSLRRSDAPQRRAIADALDRLENARTLEDATEAHLDFHAALLSRCPSAWTRRIAGILSEHAQRYVLLGAQRFRSGRGPAVEHAELCAAALAGNVDRAVEILEAHLRGTLDSVRAALADAPAAAAKKGAPKTKRSSR